MKITARRAKAADLPAVYDLVKELAAYEHAADQVTASLEDYQRDFADHIYEALVAEQAGVVVGMMIYYMTYSTWRGRMLYLEDFVVKASHRKQGVGQVLFDAFIQTAKEKAVKMVKWQVLDWNEPAIRFYEKNQAIIEKDWWNAKIFLFPTKAD